MIKNKNLPWATLINMGTVIIGGLIGLSLKGQLSGDMDSIFSQAIGLGVLIIGIQMALKLPGDALLVFILSLVFGGFLGQLLGIDQQIDTLGNWFQMSLGVEESTFASGFVTAFLLFCVGSLTIIGAIEEGVQGKRDLLLVKSVLDGISSVVLTAKLGYGVIFSIFPMLLFQGGITVLASFVGNRLKDYSLDLISAVGGTLIVGLSLNILGLTQLKVENLLPALVLIFPFTYLWKRWGPKL